MPIFITQLNPVMKTILFIHLLFISILCNAQLDKKQTKALNKWLSAATKDAEKGNVDSMEVLGNFYSNEILPGYILDGNIKNPQKNSFSSQKWYRACAALGNANCNYQMGLALINRIGFEETDSTIYFLKKAANAGNADAMYWLGEIYYNSSNRDLVQARSWYQKAADKNNVSAKIMLNQIKIGENNSAAIADSFFKIKNYAQALENWKIAASVNKDKLAAFNIGTMYYHGYGVTQDFQAAKSAFELSGNLGYAEGSYQAALLWYDKGGTDWREKARDWYAKAVEQGNMNAKPKLDFVTAEINKINADIAKAKEEKELAARQKRDLQNNLSQVSTSSTSPNYTTPSTAKRKACPFCGGKGYTSSHETFTDGRQDKNNVTQYGQTTRRNCSYCKGAGYITN